MNITIVGPGAIGSLFYYLLSKKVKALTLLDKDPKRAASLRKKGLTVLKDSKTFRIPLNITSDPAKLKDTGLFIVCVKSYDTLKAAEFIKPACKEKSFVLSVQNGLGNLEMLSEILGEKKILGAVTHKASTLLNPGIIKYTADGQTVLGKKGKKVPAVLREVRSLFNSAKIPTSISKDLDSVIWSKLVINSAINPLTAVLRVKNGGLLKSNQARLLMQMAGSEVERVAKRKRVKLLYDDIQTKLEAVCRVTSENISSMFQDVLTHKKTEIDALNGAVYRLGQSLKIPTPINFLLYNLVKSLEESYPQAV